MPRGTSEGEPKNELLDVGAKRLVAMDESGVDVQVLSTTTPGVQNLSANDAVSLQQQVNDFLINAVSSHRDRFLTDL